MKRILIVLLMLWSGTAEARLGSDIVLGWNLTNWTVLAPETTIVDNNTFTVAVGASSYQGIFKTTYTVTAGKKYRTTLLGSATNNPSISVRIITNAQVLKSGFGTSDVTATASGYIYVQCAAGGLGSTVDLSSFSICEVLPPTRAVTPGAKHVTP